MTDINDLDRRVRLLERKLQAAEGQLASTRFVGSWESMDPGGTTSPPTFAAEPLTFFKVETPGILRVSYVLVRADASASDAGIRFAVYRRTETNRGRLSSINDGARGSQLRKVRDLGSVSVAVADGLVVRALELGEPYEINPGTDTYIAMSATASGVGITAHSTGSPGGVRRPLIGAGFAFGDPLPDNWTSFADDPSTGQIPWVALVSREYVRAVFNTGMVS